MKGNVLADAKIQKLLNEFVFAELYTDRGTPDDDENNRLRIEKYGGSLPLYYVLDGEGNVRAKLEGLTTIDGFTAFLKQGLAADGR